MVLKRNYLLGVVIAIIIISGGFYMKLKVKQNQNRENGPVQISKENIGSQDIIIRQTDNGFEPQEITVKKGTRVVFVNDTSSYNWPASNLHPTHGIYPEFDPLQPIDSGKAWAFVFDKVGEWGYHDHLRPNRRGIVKVTEN